MPVQDRQRRDADRAGRAAFVVALLVGAALIYTPGSLGISDGPTADQTTTTASSSTVDSRNAVPPAITTTSNTTSPTPSTSDPPKFDLVGELFTPGVRALLQGLVIVAAATVCGAATQRLWLGRFQLKLGPVQIDEVTSQVVQSSTDLTELVETKILNAMEESRKIIRRLDDRVDGTLDRVRNLEAAVEQLDQEHAELLDTLSKPDEVP